MKLTDERRRALTGYLGECHHEGRMPINCGYRCVKCGDTYVVNRTFDNDDDMMALFRKIKDSKKFSSFWHFAVSKERDAVELDWLFYNAERFCNLVAEWLEVKK
jgi:hypothetical protein